MNVKIFRSEVDKTKFGFVKDDAGVLPADLAPWHFEKEVDLMPGENRIGVKADSVFDALNEHGFFVSGAEIKSTGA